MKFAFLVHPLTEETKALLQLDNGGLLRGNWKQHPRVLPRPPRDHGRSASRRWPLRLRPGWSMNSTACISTGRAEGRLYEIPMDATAFWKTRPGD